MRSKIKIDPERLSVFHEGRKRRILVGELHYIKNENRYEFIYHKKYVHSKNAIPIGPDLEFIKLKHKSPTGKLFSSFSDRIPDKANPAYKDYCKSMGISVNEKNPIILLASIGKRGPSSFIFEPIYQDEFRIGKIKEFREKLALSQYDFSEAFDINLGTLQKIEAGLSFDSGTVKRIQIFFRFPEVALWQLKMTGARIPAKTLSKISRYFEDLAVIAK